jgi:autotransporter-associated beta strand protein
MNHHDPHVTRPDPNSTTIRTPSRRQLALLAFITLITASFAHAATVTWDASGTNPTAPTDGAGNWSTANANWSDGITDSVWINGDNALFGSGGAGGAITVGSGVTVGNLTINTNYTFSGNPLTLANNPTITVAGPATVSTVGNLIAGTGFTKAGSGRLFLNQSANNTFTGDTIINDGSIQPGSTGGRLYVPGNLIINTNGSFIAVSGSPGSGVFGNGVLVLNGQHPYGSNVFVNSGAWITANTAVLANGAVITNGGGAISGTYAVTNTDARSGAVWLTRHGFGVVNTIAKSTAGTVIMASRPNASATDGFIATLNAGTLMFDYAYAANAAVKLQANSPLTFAGGMLVFSNSSSALNPSANNPGTGGTFFNSGASSLFSTNAGASGGNLTMGAITRRAGATFNLVRPIGPGAFGSSVTANVNGIVGGWNTFNLTDWTTGTSTWIALAAGNYTVSTDPTTWAAANNVSLNASTSPNVPDLKVINSLRLTNAATVTLDGSLTLSSGGLLVIGTGATAITGGTLKGASGVDLIVHQNASADLTISSDLADNGAATSLTKAGSGKLIITGANTMTGTNFFNGGVVEVSDLAKLASGPLDLNGGTLHYTGVDTTSARGLTTRGLGPNLAIVGGTIVTQSAVIRGSGDVLGDFGGLTKSDSGTLILTASNYFNGETLVSGGTLLVNGTNAYNNTVWDAGRVTVAATLGGTGLIAGPVTVKNGGVISPGASIGTLTLGSHLTLESGSTSHFEVTNAAAGDLLVVQGNLTIQPNSTIAISVLGTPLETITNTLITYAGTKSGSFNPTIIVNGALNGSVALDENTPGQIKLVVIPEVVITTQPANTVVSTNDNATFTVVAIGTAPLAYQWYRYADALGNSPVAQTDATNASVTILNAQDTDTGFYGVVVTNDFSSVTSQVVSLLVGDLAPVITGPTNKTVIAGNNVTFNTSVVIANPQPAFQWQTNGVDVAGATSASLTLNNVPFALDGTVVSVIATNIAGNATNNATLTVIVTPVITPQPTNLTVNVGDTATFYSGATGVPTPALQWYKNGIALSGETSATLTIANAQGASMGNYTLVATNIAGVATSASVKLTVISTNLAAVSVAPANNATGVGYDTPLYLTFNNPVFVRNSGKIRIYNATNSTTPVDTIDMASNSVVIATLNSGLGVFLTNNIQPHGAFQGDGTAFNYFPVITTGNTAAIYPHLGVLTSNQTYYVTLENGVVADSNGAYFTGISDTNAWRFTTKPTGPASTTSMVVAADGSGDFITVQGAIDSVPAASTTPRLITVKNGTYTEIVNISGKHNLTIRGQSRTGTIIGYGNNNNLNGSTANRMAFKINANDIAVENLTLVNTTPQGGSQAEAIMVNTAAKRFIVNNCDVNSLQDTILVNVNSSQAFLHNSTIRGNFDYIWGGGNVFITNCVIRTVPNIYVTNNYNLTASRTDAGATGNWAAPVGVNQFTSNGISYVNCRLEADAAVNTVTLAGANGTANGLASWIGCFIDTNHYVTPAPAILSNYLLWEYGNFNLDGSAPVSMGLTTLTNNDPRLLAAQNATIWLNGWTPQLAPNILTNPTSQIVNAGNPATFTVAATGVPAPAYQWLHEGTNAPYATATNATLIIPNALAADAGTYSVIVSNAAGAVTSTSVTLTVNLPPAPTIGSLELSGGEVSFLVSGTIGYNYGIQTSTNLVDWQTVYTTNATTVPFGWSNSDTTDPMRFYRVLFNP